LEGRYRPVILFAERWRVFVAIMVDYLMSAYLDGVVGS
jgi:hypothetical protein